MKICSKCQKPKRESEFSPNSRNGKRAAECKQCHRDRNNSRNRFTRVTVLKYYGGDPPRCACCKETRLEFLALDHIHGGGRQHRKLVKIRWWEWLLKNGFPKGFRVLCHNCNQSLGIYGYCPHKKSSKLSKEVAAFDENAPNLSYKLSQRDVNKIRRLLANGVTGVSIANKYHVSRATVTHIKQGKTWRP